MINSKENLAYLFELIKSVRSFFNTKDFVDVQVPPMVPNPGMEVHIHPFQLYSAKNKELLNQFLHTSPEFYMKLLLSKGFEKIFNLSYSFREEPSSPIHRPQFLMLEWYRAHENYESLMQDTFDLVRTCYESLVQKYPNLKNFSKIDIEQLEMKKLTVQQLFQEVLQIDILNYLDKEDLKNLIQKNYKDVPLGSNLDKYNWDDFYFSLFLNKVEPKLKQYPFLILYEFPAPLAALSRLKESDTRVCERFEVYMNGDELCNCFHELTNLKEQKKRFEISHQQKQTLYDYQLPEPNVLYQALEKMPSSSGNALGVERLLNCLFTLDNCFFN
jgi:elongation factor P--(R)-beta-lysine ligase